MCQSNSCQPLRAGDEGLFEPELSALRINTDHLCRRTWLMPVLDRLFPNLHGRLTTGWERALKDSGKLGAIVASTREDDSAANEEIINDRLLRELTTEYLVLLRSTQEKAEGQDARLCRLVTAFCIF